MTEILIRCNDIEMPKNGTLTLVVYPNGDVYLGDVLKDTKMGKAIELQPHGDLKDYDFIGNKMSNIYKKNRDKWNPDFADGFMYALKMLDKAPTVMEASND